MPVFDGVKLKKCLACFDEPHLESYFHQLVDSWKCRGKLNFKDHSSVIGLENWWDLEAELKQLAKAFVNSETELEFLGQLNGFESNLKDCLLMLLNLRHNDLKGYFLSEAKALTQNNLSDFDWSLKLTSSSDKQSKLNEMICSVSFVSGNQLAASQDSFYFEMTRSELDKFISDLETIQSVSETRGCSLKTREQIQRKNKILLPSFFL